MDLAFWKVGCTSLPFVNLASTLGRVKSSIPHGAWRFYFFISKNKIKICHHLHIH
jgi:hypothetical protein